MKNLRMEKLAQLRGIVKTALGETEVADAIKQIRAAKNLQELDALKAKAEADTGRSLLTEAQKASMQSAYDLKKSQLGAAGGASTAPTPATQTAGGASSISADSILHNDTENYVDIYQNTVFLKSLQKEESIFLDTRKDTVLYLNGNQAYAKLINAGTLTPGNKVNLSSYFSSTVPQPQATRRRSGGGSNSGSSDKTAVIKTDLWGTTVSDRAYKYVISNDGKSFQWANADKSGVHKQGDSGWGKMVDNLNLIPPTGQTRNTATPAAAATPATTGATTNPAATGPDQVIVSKIAKVLTVGMTKPLAIATAGDEIKQITEMSTFLAPKGGIMALASIIASKVGGTLGALNAADIATVNAAGQKELAINRRGPFAADTAVIMRQVNLLYSAFLDNKQSLNAYWEKKASVSLDKKFVKAATLRRMRVRSQMEAAVDSSAQMGRSRVF